RLGAVEVVSLGGATEGSIWSILYPIGTVLPEWRSIPYGRAMANQRMYVLNEALSLCPAWVPGDLYIGGAGVARGYWGAEERTAASFLVHPRTGERLYRTGDLGRFLPDGTIEFLGREDFQVKVQGYRIELGEIESVLSRHAAVRSCVVAALGEAQGSKRLVAYVVGEPGGEESEESLRAYLAGKLPAYMVPSSYVFLESLPLSATGKVDRRALPLPLTQRHEAVPGGPGSGSPLAETIRQIVERVLGFDRVEWGANLLDLGANSVDLIRISNQLERELSFRPTMEEFFRTPTVAGLAELYAQERPETAVPEAASRWSPESVVDPEERERFKERRLDLRPADPARRHLDLEAGDAGQPELRSERFFAAEPILNRAFGRFLASLRELPAGDHTQRLYPSAGGAYPVQVYLHVKAGRVEGIPAGTYYYHPAEHRLVALTSGVELDPGIHADFINRPIFERSAFSLFLIAQAGAIAPLYGKRARDFCLLEAGAMLQLLRAGAPACGLGICPIGGLDFDAVHPLFALDEGHELVHSLVGGALPTSTPSVGRPSSASVGLGEPGDRGRAVTKEPPLLRIPRDGELPLSSPQLRLWFLDQLEPGNPAYNVFGTVRVSGAFDLRALELAISEIVRRQEVLRATSPVVAGQPQQRIAPSRPVPLPVVDLRGLLPAAREEEVVQLAWAEAALPFDLGKGPLLRCALVDLEDDECLVLFTMHHIVSDAWSRGILVTELVPLYAAFAAGRPSPLPEPAFQYVDFAA